MPREARVAADDTCCGDGHGSFALVTAGGFPCDWTSSSYPSAEIQYSSYEFRTVDYMPRWSVGWASTVNKIVWALATTTVILGGFWLSSTGHRDALDLPEEAIPESHKESNSAVLPPRQNQPVAPAEARKVQVRESNRAELASVGSAVVPQIEVTPGFESILNPHVVPPDTEVLGVPVRRHLKVQREGRDNTWAPRVESDIRTSVRNELVVQGFDPNGLEMKVIECRSTDCEIQAVGNPPGNYQVGDFQTVMNKLLSDGGLLSADFDKARHLFMMQGLPDNKVGYVVFLPRTSGAPAQPDRP